MVAAKQSEIRRSKGASFIPKHSDHADLRRRKAEDIYFGKDAPEINWDGRLSPQEEMLAFERMHYCAYRMNQAERGRNLTPSQKHYRISKWRARYEELREKLVNNNMGLVYDMLRRSHFRNADPDDLLGEGLFALLRSVQSYDPWRGYRFSTYACNSILRAFIREAMRQTKLRDQAPMSFDAEMEEVDVTAWRRAIDQALVNERLNRILDNNLADLSDLEQRVLAKRFPREVGVKRLTLDKLGREMNISKERVRQIQKGALLKLRATVSADPVLFPSDDDDVNEADRADTDFSGAETDPSESDAFGFGKSESWKSEISESAMHPGRERNAGQPDAAAQAVA